MQHSEAEIRATVIESVAKALDLEPEEVGPDDSLEQDLGAESLDFLDLAFMLERAFGVHMPRLDLLQRAEEHYGAGVLVQDGRVTEAGRDLLRRAMPEIDPEALVAGMRASDVGRLITVRTFERVVSQLLADKEATRERGCPECGGALEPAPATPELRCQAGDHEVPLASGDDVLLRHVLTAGSDLEPSEAAAP